MLSRTSMGSCISSRMGEQLCLAPPALLCAMVMEGCGGTWDCTRPWLSEWLTFPTRKYWTLSSFWDSGIQGAFSIADTWPGLPAVIDAAFQDVLTKRVFFFSGELHPCRPRPRCRWCCEEPGATLAP